MSPSSIGPFYRMTSSRPSMPSNQSGTGIPSGWSSSKVMADNYTIEYGVTTTNQAGDAMPIYLNEGGEHGERKYVVGGIFKMRSNVMWHYSPTSSIRENDNLKGFSCDNLDTLKEWIEDQLRGAGILALGGGRKYDPLTGVGVKKTIKKPRRKGKRCTNTFLNGDRCDGTVPPKLVKKGSGFDVCEPCAKALGIL